MMNLSFDHLVQYTDWERQKWRDWLRKHGDDVLKISAGPNGDGRFQTIGDLVRHIFSAEKRYVERIHGLPLSDTGSVPTDNIEALFQFGERSRNRLKAVLQSLPAEQWDIASEHKILDLLVIATPRKLITHTLLHEIRHWAQLATLLRLNGLTMDFQDFLASPVMGGEIKRDDVKA